MNTEYFKDRNQLFKLIKKSILTRDQFKMVEIYIQELITKDQLQIKKEYFIQLNYSNELIEAAQNGFVGAVESLIQNGANVDAKNE